mgnify:CR=1 FL=1
MNIYRHIYETEKVSQQEIAYALGLSRPTVTTNLSALEEDGLIHKLLGHSDNVQGGMELECEMVSRGIYAGNPSGYREAERLNLRRFAGRWKLLLQIDSEEELGMMWGDCGRLYFWITEDDLAARRFGKAWLILQCG